MRRPSSLLVLLLFAVACGDEPVERHVPVGFLNLSQDVGYVGMETCRDCHVEEHDTYQHTGMGRAFYPMSPEEVVEDFTTNNEFVVEPWGLRYRMEERDGRYYQRQFLLDSRGQEILAEERELIWVIGSNNNSRSYVVEVDGKFFQAPACWYPKAAKWELCPGYEFKNEHFGREISMSCLHCHNGRMEPLEGERNLFHEPYPMGIGCERCHGPGQLHVEHWQSTEDEPTGERDLTIVNPERLPTRERIEICFQCHLGDARATERVVRKDRPLETYRPGERMTEVVIPYTYVEPTENEFGISAQADRLISSRCYQESGGKIDCMTCHNPHVTTFRDDLPENHYRRACLGCHTVEACSGDARHRAATEPPDQCISCHMRRAEPDDHRFTRITDHWIRREIETYEEAHRESYEIRPVFPERMAEFDTGERYYYQARARSLLARDAPSNRRPEMWRKAATEYEKAIKAGYDTADAWYYLAKMRKYLGKREASDDAFRRAYEIEPTAHDPAYAWGQVLLDQRKPTEALSVFEAMLSRDADDPLALAEAGRAAMALRDSATAERYLRRATELEPWVAAYQLNLAKVMAAQGRFEEAAAVGAVAARLDPDEIGVWVFYENVMLQVGRTREAAEGRAMRERLQQIEDSGYRPQGSGGVMGG